MKSVEFVEVEAINAVDEGWQIWSRLTMSVRLASGSSRVGQYMLAADRAYSN